MKIIDVGDFRALAGDRTRGKVSDGQGNEIALCRDASIDPSFNLETSTSRQIPYVLSNNSVARDNHTVKSDGFELGNYRSNPVFLWAHDSSQPPVGKMVDVTMSSTALRGIVEYATRDLSEFADMIFRMVKQRYLNAVSISWLPLEWKFSTDRNRIGGIDFLRQDLLEVSQVPVPAMATALATARAAGIDTAPMVRWAEQILDSAETLTWPRSSVERTWLAARGRDLPTPHEDASRARRRREVEAIVTKARGDGAALRCREAEALALLGSCH